LFFSAANVWEISIKNVVRRKDFPVDLGTFCQNSLANGCVELPITSEHAIAIQALPPIHKDSFDRILIAQATVEGITLLTSDRHVARYPSPIRKI